MEGPRGTVSVGEILAYLRQDRHLDLKQAADYLALGERTLWKLLPEIPHFRLGRKILFRRSELDIWIERYRERATVDNLDRIADEVVADVLGRGSASARKV